MYRQRGLQSVRRSVISAVLLFLVFAILPAYKAYSETAGVTLPEKPNTEKADDRDIHSIIPLQKEFNTRADWYAVAYEGISPLDGVSEETPSRLCFRKGRNGKDEDCFSAEKDRYRSKFTNRFWNVLELKVLPFFKHSQPHNVLMFNTRFFGGGSDWLDLVTLWSYNRKIDRFVQITPKSSSKGITFTSQGGYRLLNFNIHGLQKIIAVGHFIWREDEGHYGDHFYHIALHVYRPGKGFVPLGKYKTKKKYSGEDIAGQPDLLFNSEIGNIKSFVFQKLK